MSRWMRHVRVGIIASGLVLANAVSACGGATDAESSQDVDEATGELVLSRPLPSNACATALCPTGTRCAVVDGQAVCQPALPLPGAGR